MPDYGNILSKALQLFRDGPTREHLLSRGVEPRILHSSYLAASVSGRADETSYELAGENNGMLDVTHSTSWLAVPTTTSGDIVLGFFVEELLTKASLAILGEQHRVDFSRFAYRDNEFLNIVQKPDIDCVEIFHMSTSSLSVVTVNNIRLSLSEFRAALRASPELNVNSLSAAVHFCTSARYSRCCLVCGASPGRACGCTLPSANLIAPVDIGAFPRNAPQFLGDFAAAGHSLHVRNLGKFCHSGPLLSRLAITPTNSPREKLLYMVAVRAGIVSVDRPMLPLVEDMPSSALGALQGFNVTQGMQLSRETAELCGSPDSTIQSDPLSLIDQDGSPLADLEPLDTFIDAYSERISSDSETATDPVQDRAEEPQDTVRSRVTPIAPRADARDIPDELLAHLTAQEEKRLKRMQKNRESAARSNLKRKQKRLQLQSDLASAKEKVEELRAIEVKLRKENRGLRLSLMSPAVMSS